ncbi:phenylalanyl-tRNA synthetase, mitochondrial isoform X2 [Lycorma delicatula]|uniref:phenylalanyl-tRNA synthetase, mitochondrial isoform X2 n=1 Tax=Lycorma delicatula TaxID=130591 RepID=UPI003F5193AC
MTFISNVRCLSLLTFVTKPIKIDQFRFIGHAASKREVQNVITVNNTEYKRDDYTNATPKILSYVGRNLLHQKYHPLSFLKRRITSYFHDNFKGRRGNPIFSVYDNLNPVVSVEKNFDSLLIPIDHVSRQKSDCYYINREFLLRAHTTAHQHELIKMGLDHFVVMGDVYRRDSIDATHFPVFHQADAVRLFNSDELIERKGSKVIIFNDDKKEETEEKQAEHTLDAVKLVEDDLKTTLLSLIYTLFGKDTPHRWVSVYFPFTHPSWELEIKHEGEWMEVLGCGIMRQAIVNNAGAGDKIGWAFGLGLERLAMHVYKIPDIRLFWSEDSGFTSQFEIEDPNTQIKFKPVSVYPQLINDISFWITNNYCSNDFYDLARDIGGSVIEQIKLIDEFHHPKTGNISHCYRVTYRHMERTLTHEEVNVIQFKIRDAVENVLKCQLR